MKKLEKVIKKVAVALSEAGVAFTDGADPEAECRKPSMESVGVNSGVVVTIKEFAHEKHWSTFLSVQNDTSRTTADIVKGTLGQKHWTDFPSHGSLWEKGIVSVDISSDGKLIILREEFERAGRL